MGKYQICVSGAAGGESAEQGNQLAHEAGAAIARAGHSLMTGATTGLPNAAAEGYKKAGGKMSLGISPASTKIEHLLKYRLPIKSYDTILYTGMHYSGRDALLVSSADGVIMIGGGKGTMHEFTIAMETKTPVGVLHGGGGVGDQIEAMIQIMSNVDSSLVLSDTDPDQLVAKLTHLLDKLHVHYHEIYQ